MAERAPDLVGITNRASNRLKDPRYHLGKPNERDTVQHEAFPGSGTATTTLEYLAESDVCHSCYVVAGYGMRGTHDTDSGSPSSLDSPISLSINDVVAMIYVNDGKEPPSSQEIENAYKKYVDPPKWKILVQNRNLPNPEDPQIKRQVLATGDEAVSDIFQVAQCIACHAIPGIPGAIGTIGPPLGLKATGFARLKDPSYRGKATTPLEYFQESILEPDRYVVSGYPKNVMPKVYGHELSALAAMKMVDYLIQLEEGKAPPPIK
jgi:hypothetical protein